MKTIQEMVQKATGATGTLLTCSLVGIKEIEAFAELVREEAQTEEREAISDEWHSSVYSDLEHGVKCLNEQAAKDWLKNYPEISKFGAWLEARGDKHD